MKKTILASMLAVAAIGAFAEESPSKKELNITGHAVVSPEPIPLTPEQVQSGCENVRQTVLNKDWTYGESGYGVVCKKVIYPDPSGTYQDKDGSVIVVIKVVPESKTITNWTIRKNADLTPVLPLRDEKAEKDGIQFLYIQPNAMPNIKW